MNNYVYINQEIKDLVFDKIKEIFEDVNYNIEHKNNIMDTLINMMYTQCIELDKKNNENKGNNNEINTLINNTLKLNFLNNFLFKGFFLLIYQSFIGIMGVNK